MPCENHPDIDVGLLRCSRCGRPFCQDCVVSLGGRYYCAPCKSEQVRDIQSGTEAGVLELASVGRRFVAIFLDGLITMVPIMVVVIVGVVALIGSEAMRGSRAGPPAELTILIIGFYIFFYAYVIFVPVAYEALFLRRTGQTLGKKAMGIRVVTPEGGSISTGQAWGRAGSRALIGLACAFIDLLPAVFTREKTCLHDMLAKTRVVRLPR